MTRIAFYAPVKPPDHPIPSGDRLIGGNLLKALELAGFQPVLASRFIAYSKREADDILRTRMAAAAEEAQAVVQRFADDPPDLFLTYHPYCKAPDWIGPIVAKTFGIPYVTVEAAHTGQGFENGQDRWRNWREQAHHGFRTADLHLCFKPADKAYLRAVLGPDAPVQDLPIFIDTNHPNPLPKVDHPKHWRPNVPVLVTTAMMRPGKKVENFRLLAKALEPLQALEWNLVIIGGGPEEATVRSFFDPFANERLHFAGEVTPEIVLAHFERADVFVWPGWKEPIGMVYLEAQMLGLPVAALASMGVPLVVRHGETGLLAPEDDPDALTENLSTLLSHPALRRDLGTTARNQVKTNHSLETASAALRSALVSAIESYKNPN